MSSQRLPARSSCHPVAARLAGTRRFLSSETICVCDESREFLRRAYRMLLRKEIDDEGMAYYGSALRDGRLTRCHIKSPSFQNWPAMPFAIADNIIADFPLINKSFNLSYSGCDR